MTTKDPCRSEDRVEGVFRPLKRREQSNFFLKTQLIFIVEGPTEEAALAQILSRIFSTSQIKFEIVHGDITIEPYNHVAPATRGRV